MIQLALKTRRIPRRILRIKGRPRPRVQGHALLEGRRGVGVVCAPMDPSVELVEADLAAAVGVENIKDLASEAKRAAVAQLPHRVGKLLSAQTAAAVVVELREQVAQAHVVKLQEAREALTEGVGIVIVATKGPFARVDTDGRVLCRRFVRYE